MGAFIRSQLAHRFPRAAALGIGIIVASVGFTLLTSAVETGALTVQGTIDENFRPAYDLLVRPPDSYTSIERERGLVRSNYLSGIYGGISMAQWQDILHLPGVQVAAPIANIGYVMPFTFVPLRINRFLGSGQFQLYRIRTSWLANNATSRYPSFTFYVYYEQRDPMVLHEHHPEEVLPSGKRISPCFTFNRASAGSVFSVQTGSLLTCFSSRSPKNATSGIDYGRFPNGYVGTVASAFFPLLVSAVDPTQEDRLVGLDSTVVQGDGLTEGLRARQIHGPGNIIWRGVPVIASTTTFVDETLDVSIERLDTGTRDVAAMMGRDDVRSSVTGLAGKAVGHTRAPISTIYRSLMSGFGGNHLLEENNVWAPRSVSYHGLGDDHLAPLTVHNPPSTYMNAFGAGGIPLDNTDVQFRKLDVRSGSNHIVNDELQSPFLNVIGRFDPSKLPGFSELSQVPLESYYPPTVEPADAASRKALGGKPLLPTQNLGDYIAQPPLLLTTLDGLKPFTSGKRFYPHLDRKAPISVIRVRVAGVTGADPTSLARIRTVAELIHERTGLAVDITAGSSPRLMQISLPPGRYGRPALTVDEPWVETGVAVRFLQALDTKSLVLFLLVLVVCVLFLANAAFASVRSRRKEIGILRCLGWSERDVFRAILGEVTTIGLVAGLVGTAVAASLTWLLDLHLPAWELLAITPISVLLTLAAGSVPAKQAASGEPLDAVNPPVLERGTSRRVRGPMTMAIANLVRLPIRTLVAAFTLFVGVAALTILVAVDAAFHRTLVGTLLGHAISLEIRPVDFLSVALVLALGALSVADVLYLNLRERAAEFVTLRTSGWRLRDEIVLVVSEALGIGALGSIAGSALGMAVCAALLRGIEIAAVLRGGAVGAAAGVAAALVASLVPAIRMEHLTPSVVLAEE